MNLNRREGGMVVDTNYEDKMYQQIEKSLSSNIDDGIYVPIEIIEDKAAIYEVQDEGVRLSRAEYIRQAREACLRQIDAYDSRSKLSEIYYGQDSQADIFHDRKKKDKIRNLFSDSDQEDALPEEIASYKSLIIRTVCAIVIALSIFIIDKIKLDFGAFSYNTIRQYVTENNQLKLLEDILVSWFK